MIARPEWFERRKYGGWGLHPKTWQAWLYIGVIMLPLIIFQSLGFWSTGQRVAVTILWTAFLLLDTGHVMVTLQRDELETKIEAYSGRNAAWAMVFFAVVGILYQTTVSAFNQSLSVDWFLVGVLFAGMTVKTASNIYYEKKGMR